MVVLADSLQQVASHSRRVNTDVQLRRRLAQQQVEDRVPEDRQVTGKGTVAADWQANMVWACTAPCSKCNPRLCTSAMLGVWL
jgi:hypothetical protein